MVRENLSVLFSCIIEGTPTPHVEWTTPNGTIFTVLSQPTGTIRILPNNSLYITMVTESDAGRYTCKAVNNVGERPASAMLTVQSEFVVWRELRYLYQYLTCKLKLVVIFTLSIFLVKVAEHSFQVPMPNSPQLLNYLCFGARFLQESRLITKVFILAFWVRCVLLPWQRGWLKTRLKKWFLFI